MARFPAAGMKLAGFTASELYKVTTKDIYRIFMQHVLYCYSDKVGYKASDLLRAGYKSVDVKEAKVPLDELLKGGWSAVMLKAAGYDPKEMRVGISSLQILIRAILSLIL